MKNIKILAIAIVIGTSGLYASNTINPPHNNSKHPVSDFDYKSNNSDYESKLNAKSTHLSEKKVYVSTNSKKIYNLNYNNKELLFKEMQLEAIKNYNKIMPDIITKE